MQDFSAQTVQQIDGGSSHAEGSSGIARILLNELQMIGFTCEAAITGPGQIEAGSST